MAATAEKGHHPNRWFLGQDGNLYDSLGNIIPGRVTFTITGGGGGATPIALVTAQVVDANGLAIAQVFELSLWLSDAATGAGLTATAASGAVAAGTPGTVIASKVSKKALDVLTDATGAFQLSITDTGTTGFFVAVETPGTGVVAVSRQLAAGDYT